MASSGGGEGEPEFQIAPMIDVLLVLLIFFMSIASTAVTRYDPSILLPVAPDSDRKEDSEGELVVNIAWHERENRAVTTFEERQVLPEDLVPVFAARLKTDPRVRVLVRGDSGTPVKHVSAVVSAAAKAGVAEVTFAALAR